MTEMVFTPISLEIDLPDRVDFVNFGFEEGSFRVRVKDTSVADGREYDIVFEDSVAQRSMDEGNYLPGTPAILAPGFEGSGSIVTVSNSEFIGWFHQQSSGIFEDQGIRHVSILTDTETLDVLCYSLPKIHLVAVN